MLVVAPVFKSAGAPRDRRVDSDERHGYENLNAVDRGHVQHGLRGHRGLHPARSVGGRAGPGGVQITQGLLLVFALLMEIPIAMIFAVPHPEAGGQPLGEHRCSCDHHRVRSGRRVDGAPLLRVLRSRGSRVHGADRLVRLGAAQLRSRDRFRQAGGPDGHERNGGHHEGSHPDRLRFRGRDAAQGAREAHAGGG